MALIYRAVLNPGKLDLLNSWLANESWATAAPATFERVDGYRFDDPVGEVGIEVFFLRAPNGPTLHVPVTYRGEPLPGGDAALIGTMEHSVLGTRYVYDATRDPVAVTALIDAITTGSSNADMIEVIGDERRTIEQTVHIIGSGVAEHGITPATNAAVESATEAGVTTVTMPANLGEEERGISLRIRRNLDESEAAIPETVPALSLHGTWKGQPGPRLLAWIPEHDER